MSQETLLSLLRIAEINGYTVILALVLISPKLVSAVCNGACEIILAMQGTKREKPAKKIREDAAPVALQEAAKAQAA
jgi:hypothetical protein